MSTPAMIALQEDNGYIRSIYCHFDGHTIGRILLSHYKDESKVKQLIDLGHLSALGKEIGLQHDFKAVYEDSDPRRSWCVAYGRDRGEENTRANKLTSFISMKFHARASKVSVIYYFNKGNWYLTHARDNELVLLEGLDYFSKHVMEG